MKKVDKLFMTMFRDLKITRDPNNGGTDEKPNYVCKLGNGYASHADVVRMVRKYQDAIIKEMLLEMGDTNNVSTDNSSEE